MIAVLNNGLQLLGVGQDLVQMIKGLVLLVAVGIDVYSKRQGRPVDPRPLRPATATAAATAGSAPPDRRDTRRRPTARGIRTTP